jgi:hypothetical protein
MLDSNFASIIKNPNNIESNFYKNLVQKEKTAYLNLNSGEEVIASAKIEGDIEFEEVASITILPNDWIELYGYYHQESDERPMRIKAYPNKIVSINFEGEIPIIRDNVFFGN